MAKNKKQKPLDIEEEIIEEQPVIIEEEETSKQISQPKNIDSDDIPDELQDIINNCGADSSYTVGVFRYDTKTQQKEKVGTYEIQDFLPDQIAKTYGGGKYEYHIRLNNKLYRRLTTTYATAIVPEKPQVPTLQDIQNMINNSHKDDTSNNTMVELMKLQQTQMMALFTTLLQNKPKEDDSFDKAIKMMSVLGVRNANNDTDKMLSVFQKGLELSTTVSNLKGDDDDEEDKSLVDKLMNLAVKSGIGQELLQKLLAGKEQNLQIPQIPQVENPLPQETIIQPQIQQPVQSTSFDLVKKFIDKHKKKILVNYNSKTTVEDLAEFYYNGIAIDDDLINAFTEVFLQDTTPLISDIAEFNEPNVLEYVKSFLAKLKDLLYNNDTEEDLEEEEKNAVSLEKSTDTK